MVHFLFISIFMKPQFSLRDVPTETFSDQLHLIHTDLLDADEPHRREILKRLRDTVCGALLLSTNGVSAAEQEKVQHNLLFDGKDDHVTIPSLYYPGRQPITLEARVIPTSVDEERTIIGNHHGNGLALRLQDGYWEFIVHNGKQYLRARSDEQAEVERQVHLSGICDGHTVRLYVHQEPQKMFSVWSGQHRASRLPFMVGADPDGGGLPQHAFTGSISALRISTVARDAVPTWKENPFGKTDRFDAVYWDFTQQDAGVIKDLSRWKHDGKMQGARWGTIREKNDAE